MADAGIGKDGFICPYCGCENYVESEDYDEKKKIEKCCDCKKKFYGGQCFTVTHHSRPDCELNGEEHRWAIDTNYVNHEEEICLKCSQYRKRN